MAYLLPWPVLGPNDDKTTRVLRHWLRSAGIARTQITRSKGNQSLREIESHRVLAISFGGIGKGLSWLGGSFRCVQLPLSILVEVDAKRFGA
jgi:hypothetical protein